MGLNACIPAIGHSSGSTPSNSVRPHEIYWFAVGDVRNCDRPACVGGSGSCIISFRLDAAVGQRHFY